MKTLGDFINVFSRVYKINKNGEREELCLDNEEKPGETALLVSVTKREMRLLLEGKIDLLFRKSYPRKCSLPMTVYFTIVKQHGKIVAKGKLYFVMHTIGIDQECERAAIKPEKFEKKFYKPQYEQASAFAWNIRNVIAEEHEMSEFIYLPDWGKPKQLKHLTRAYAYVIRHTTN